MRSLLYDDQVTGHHLPYLRLIDAELLRRDQPALVASPYPPDPPSDRWIEVQQVPYRHVIQARSQVKRVASQARRQGADTFIDLFFDKNAWVVGSTARYPSRIHVLHHVDQLAPDARSGLQGVRSAALRRLVGRKSVDGSSIVVHTPQAAEIMSEVFHADRLFYARYPVEVNEKPQDRRAVGEEPVLAFIGGARHEKGLDILADAVSHLRVPLTVRVLGPQPEGTQARLGPRFGATRVEWHDAVLSIQDLRSQLAGCTLAVLPYRRHFGLYGGSSASLLDAMAAGVPVVVSPAIADQVAPGYGAVTTSAGEDARELAEAIRHGLEKHDELAHRARRVGPRFLAANHSVSGYVDTLARAAASSAG